MTADLRHERPAQISIGMLKPCLLAHLLGTTAYGYELHHRLLAIGLECELGTIYRALNTMEEDGLLRSTWEMSQGGRSRHRYELSEAGADMVDSYAPSVEQLLRIGHAFLDLRRQTGGVDPGSPTVEEATPAPRRAGVTADLTGSARPLGAHELALEPVPGRAGS